MIRNKLEAAEIKTRNIREMSRNSFARARSIKAERASSDLAALFKQQQQVCCCGRERDALSARRECVLSSLAANTSRTRLRSQKPNQTDQTDRLDWLSVSSSSRSPVLVDFFAASSSAARQMEICNSKVFAHLSRKVCECQKLIGSIHKFARAQRRLACNITQIGTRVTTLSGLVEFGKGSRVRVAVNSLLAQNNNPKRQQQQ